MYEEGTQMISESNMNGLNAEEGGAVGQEEEALEYENKKISVKLFVGQIPKAWKIKEIKDFFMKFGEIEEAQIITDTQGNHRGCAFVKFLSLTEADVAIASLNEFCFLPGSSAKLQLKWADGEARRLGLEGLNPKNANKLFISSFPSQTTEE